MGNIMGFFSAVLTTYLQSKAYIILNKLKSESVANKIYIIKGGEGEGRNYLYALTQFD